MVAVTTLSKLNAFNNFRWYPDKGCYTEWIVSRLTERSVISSFVSKKNDKKPSLISEDKLDYSSFFGGSHVAVHLNHIHSHQTILSNSTPPHNDWALPSLDPARDHRAHLIKAKTLKSMKHPISSICSNKRSFILSQNGTLCVRSIMAIPLPNSET